MVGEGFLSNFTAAHHIFIKDISFEHTFV